MLVRRLRLSIQWTGPCHISQIMRLNPGSAIFGGNAMRYVLVLVGIVSLATFSAAAQGVQNNSLLLTLPFASPFAAPASPGPTSATLPYVTGTSASLTLATLTSETPAAPANASLATLDAGIASPASSAAAEPEPQYVQSVHQQYAWQAYVGYTFFRFYESSHPTVHENTNGANWSIVYYWKDWLGIDGEMSATHGDQGGQSSWFLFGGGGPRFRWSGPRGLELWGHALLGGSHFTPQTPFGKQEAFAYEVGGGVDINTPKNRFALRFGADMIGSHYFSTYQYSPKVSAGLVFKF